MNQDPIVETQPTKRSVAHWVTLARSVLALTLGLGLILEPDKTRPMLINFIGMFWLMGGRCNLLRLRSDRVPHLRVEPTSFR